jgi:hypothetical protein
MPEFFLTIGAFGGFLFLVCLAVAAVGTLITTGPHDAKAVKDAPQGANEEREP